MKVTASIVLYKPDVREISILLKTLCSSIIEKIIVVDNSPSRIKKMFLDDASKIMYVHNPSNSGFGAGHNIAIVKALALNSDYHFIVNPDISLDSNVVDALVAFMAEDRSIGMVMPQILNADGSIQYLPKLLPTPFSVISRKLKWFSSLQLKFKSKYELQFVAPATPYEAPIISGCFTLVNLSVIKHIGMFDERFFLYFEDWDLSRRVNMHYKTVYFPFVSVYHGYKSEANKSLKLFFVFIRSAVLYFNKWGWFYDKKRKSVNYRTLHQFNQ